MKPVPSPRRHVLLEANHGQLVARPPNVAVLPWGATEAHNRHLPYGTDVIEATTLAERAAELADARGARVVVLPTIPFGSDAQQLDQVATIHLSAPTAFALLRDVVTSLGRQGIDRLVILNAHGGNDFRTAVRDLALESGSLIVVVNFWQVRPELLTTIFAAAGDHAGEMETSLLMHLRPELVAMEQAGPGATMPWKLGTLRQPGVWTPRPWSHVHPDTGAGDPAAATAAKGAEYFAAITAAIAEMLVEISAARKGDLPYV